MSIETDDEYNKMLAHAISQIGVLSDEWTNRLPSDPGITILENLTAFMVILKDKCGQVPEEVKTVLPMLLGIVPEKPACARVLLRVCSKIHSHQPHAPSFLPCHQKFFLEDLCFETLERTEIFPGKMEKVFREHQGRIEELKELTPGNPLTAKVFGDRPEAGDSLYLMFDGPFAKAGGEVLLYVHALEPVPRVPFDEGYPVHFAEAKWSCLTENGYEQVECMDSTNVFLTSGELKIQLGKSAPVTGCILDSEGCLLKCTLLQAAYDCISSIRHIEGPLFEAYEMDSMAMSFVVNTSDVQSFIKELEDAGMIGEGRHLYTFAGTPGDGYVEMVPDKKPDGGSGKSLLPGEQESWKLVCMEREMEVQKKLGILYGYDSQEFPVVLPGNMAPESVEIMAEKQLGEERRFYFFKPGDSREGAIRYECGLRENLIRILDAGDFEGCRVSVSSCAVFHGEEGNVRAGNVFLRSGGVSEEYYYNPRSGIGGRKAEDLKEIRSRLADLSSLPRALVTEADYEQAVRHTPGLCVHKVRALKREDRRAVQIYVKPYGKEPLPNLSELYRGQIRRYLEERRLMGVALTVSGPEYIAIDVFAELSVKMQYADSQSEIKNVIRRELDHVNGVHGFGGIVSRQELADALEQLPGVEYILKLALATKGKAEGAKIRDLDIVLPPNALCCAGDIQLMFRPCSAPYGN